MCHASCIMGTFDRRPFKTNDPSMFSMIWCDFKLICIFTTILISQCSAMQCESKERCDECIQTFDCAWCLKSLDNDLGIHCYNKTSKVAICPEHNTIDPIPIITVTSNEQIKTAGRIDKGVQITPQRMTLMLRKDEELTIDFKFGQSSDFPVDLYYIMDLSASLKEDKKNLAGIGKELVNIMQKITSDFKIGFGSFVDKPDAPFVSTQPTKLEKPCEGCVRAYSFKNHLSLTENGTMFANEVDDAIISGNLDVPEGGFDALMQAIVCQKEIGWREHTTRIIVFTTDAAFHVAGDGKLAGIVIPNDGSCHMKNNEYTDALKYDYPSISHINYVAKKHNVHILFAVKDKVENIYKSLEKVVENSRAVKLVGKEIITEIKHFYGNISSSVKFSSTPSSNVYVTYSSDCMGNEEFSKTVECTGVGPAQALNFKAKIKPIKCFDGEEIIRIKPSTQDATLEIALRTSCKCVNCGPDVQNSPECNHHGHLHCGVCECGPGFNGKQCECDQSKNEDFQKFDKCKDGNDTEICSGRGTCLCNVCNCNKKEGGLLISGKYCECDNYSCPKYESIICGNHGECVCGQCKCNPDWSGDACECPNDLTTCTKNGDVCNGKGTCKCGKCACDKPYFGQYCDHCPDCYGGGKCDELKPCIECKVHNKGKYKDDCDIKCTQYTINIVDSTTDYNNDDSKECRYIEENCQLVFTYKYENDKFVAFTMEELECSNPINLIALILGIIGGILVIGIVSLIAWKFWTNYKDTREYARFEEERGRGRWNTDGNPIFKPAVSEFRNPMYGKRQSSMHKRKTRNNS